ncbi:MAG: ABC transporter ATP-binding protein [Opitutaceae bacterium]
MESSELTVEVEHLCKRYGRKMAVSDVSFWVRRGEIVGLLGPNGAGKSTTMKILTGFQPATSGVVRVCGIPVAARPTEAKRRIGYMPENNPLPEDIRVREYLSWRARLKGLNGRRRRERIDAVLELCDLKRAQKRIIGRLSKGFRQRVGIADAILAEPDLIIMDEPTIGLDPHQIVMIRELIESIRGRMSMMISSHILPEIEMTCDRVLIINGGRIVAQGSPEQLRQKFIDRTIYEVEIQGQPAAFQAELASLHNSLALESHEPPGRDGFFLARVRADGVEDWGETLLQRLGQHPAFRLRSLNRRKATLEEVFLAATRRSWDTLLPERNGDPSHDDPVEPRRSGTKTGS